ncbi:hypothetical protein PEC18_06865 [Paucibacter sp. O1-1]|nr:hypothetical protein [Paucibacter sp. O1-1]MDA3825592.1 hypothetical protein [Paucibacter sp. O1-1]
MKAFCRSAPSSLFALLRWGALLLTWLALPALAQLPTTASPRLDRTELALEVGASAALTISLPGPATTAQTYIVSTTRPDLLQVPARVSLPVGARSVSVPVQGQGAGVGLVRVIANTRQLAATVRVIEAGTAGLQSVQPLPATVRQGASASLRLDLSAVPSQNVAIALGSDAGDALALPAQAIVPAGQRHVLVAVLALQPGAHTVHADLGTQRLEALLRVTPAAAAVQALHPSRSELEVGTTLSVELLLSGFSSVPVDVVLAATPAGVIEHPPTVQVPAGADRVSLQLKGLKKGQVLLSAEGGSRSASSTVVVRDPVGVAVSPLLSLRPPALTLGVGATATVDVELDAVRAYDQVLTLALAQQQAAASGSGSAAVLIVPASLTVPAGQRGASFQIAGAASGSARVSVRAANSAALSYLDVAVLDQASLLTELTPTQQSLPKGTVGQLLLRIAPNSSAPSTANLSTDAADVLALPPTVTVAPGQSQASIPLTARAEGQAQISASLNGSSATARVMVTPPVVEELRPPKDFSLGVGSVERLPVQALLTDGTLDDAPEGLVLSSDKPGILSVEPDGRLKGVGVGQAKVEVRLGAIRLIVPVTVVQLPALSLSPAAAELSVGASLVYTLASSSPAPAGGLTALLSYSGEGGLELPASVILPAGASSVQFVVKALSAGAVTLRAEAPGRQPASASLLKKQATLSITGASPLRGPAGTSITLAGTGFDAATPAGQQGLYRRCLAGASCRPAAPAVAAGAGQRGDRRAACGQRVGRGQRPHLHGRAGPGRRPDRDAQQPAPAAWQRGDRSAGHRQPGHPALYRRDEPVHQRLADRRHCQLLATDPAGRAQRQPCSRRPAARWCPAAMRCS